MMTDMKRIWFAILLGGVIVALSGCSAGKDMRDPDSSNRHGGGTKDPNTLRMTDEYESAIPADAIKSFDDVRKEAVLPDEMR